MNKQTTQSCDVPRQVNIRSQRLLYGSIHLFNHHIPMEHLLLGVTELLLFILALYVGIWLRFGGAYIDATSVNGDVPLFPKALLFAIAMSLSMISIGAYQRSGNQSFIPMVLRIAQAVLFSVVPLSLLYYFAPMLFLGRGVMALAATFSFAGVVAIRLIFFKISKDALKPRILVLGAGKNARLIQEAYEKGELNGVNILAFCAISNDVKMVDPAYVADIEMEHSLIDIVEKGQASQIILAMDERRNTLPVADILDCKMSGVTVVDLQSFFERETGKVRLDILTPSWLFLSEGFRRTMLRRTGKRLFDIVTAGTLLVLAAPVMLVVAACVFIEGKCKSPILYRQVRVGQNGAQFKILKFRSMLVNAEVDGVARWAQRNDCRVTRVGAFIRKTRLDELPQLLNVLRGQMSLVGPRPERREFTRQLSTKIPYYNERHRVKPGLTGWAQIRYAYGSNEEDAMEKLQYDLYYTKNYSIFMDVLILLQTVEVVLWGRGAR